MCYKKINIEHTIIQAMVPKTYVGTCILYYCSIRNPHRLAQRLFQTKFVFNV